MMVPLEEDRELLEKWARLRLNEEAEQGEALLLGFWTSSLEEGVARLPRIDFFDTERSAESAAGRAALSLVRRYSDLSGDPLTEAIQLILKCFGASKVRQIADNVLEGDESVSAEARRIWRVTAFALDPRAHTEALFEEYKAPDIAHMFAGTIDRGYVDQIEPLETADWVPRDAATIKLLGPISSPDVPWGDSRIPDGVRYEQAVRRSVNRLVQVGTPEASSALRALVLDESLEVWRRALEHAASEQTKLIRDRSFAYPKPSLVLAAVDCGPPANAADLRSIAVDELKLLRNELRTSHANSWKRFWIVDSLGRARRPLIENECRDYVLDRLGDRLTKYQIGAILPEVPDVSALGTDGGD